MQQFNLQILRSLLDAGGNLLRSHADVFTAEGNLAGLSSRS